MHLASCRWASAPNAPHDGHAMSSCRTRRSVVHPPVQNTTRPNPRRKEGRRRATVRSAARDTSTTSACKVHKQMVCHRAQNNFKAKRHTHANKRNRQCRLHAGKAGYQSKLQHTSRPRDRPIRIREHRLRLQGRGEKADILSILRPIPSRAPQRAGEQTAAWRSVASAQRPNSGGPAVSEANEGQTHWLVSGSPA